MRTIWAHGLVLLLVALLPIALPAPASAFCGFYVASAEGRLFNEATMVVMMREGNTTVLSMQNDYRGPPQDFAMVIPVPIVLHEENVRTLPREVFDRVDRLASPRLVEYWEQDPCSPEADFAFGGLGLRGFGRGGGGTGEGTIGLGHVTVEAEFAVGEYDIVILGADDSGALDAWLRAHDYRIPDGAEPVLRPYVEAGMKFFVARVDVERVTFEDGHAVLSPLRFHYPSEEFSLPVRLGLLNSAGTQDLIVHVLARDRRYELANYPNVFIPTNLDVQNDVRERFGEFYAALFDRTLERNPNAIVTEYSWQATGCDPCPGPVLSESDLLTLGADVALSPQGGSAPPAARATGSPVRIGAPTVRGNMDRNIVSRVARRHINELRFCHQQALNGQPGVSGRARVSFVITPTGAVGTASVADSTLGHAPLEACITQAVRRWTFPSDADGVVMVDLPLTFGAQGAPPSSGLGPIGRIGSFGGGLGSFGGPMQSFVLTRLHYRYGREELGRDLVFREASAIVGGRGIPGENGELEAGAMPSEQNNFQGRYVIRHPWTGEVACESPRRGSWGGPPGGGAEPDPLAATNLARAPRGQVQLASMLAAPVPALGIDAVGEAAAPSEAAPSEPSVETDETPRPPEPAQSPPSGCGCRAARGRGSPGWMIAVALAIAGARRRRR